MFGLHRTVPCVLLLLTASTVACSRSLSPEDIVRGFVQAHNRGDIERAAAFFHDEAQIRGKYGRVQGKQALLEMERYDRIIGSRLTFEGLDGEGDTVKVGRIRETNELVRGLGFDAIEYRPGTTITVRDGKIMAIHLAELNEASAAWTRRLVEALQQATGGERERLKSLVGKDGHFYCEATARALLDVVQKRQKAK